MNNNKIYVPSKFKPTVRSLRIDIEHNLGLKGNLIEGKFLPNDKLIPAKRLKGLGVKARKVSIKIVLPESSKPNQVIISRDSMIVEVWGRANFLQQKMSCLLPESFELYGYYERSKNEKILYSYKAHNKHASANIHWVLINYKKIFVIDTNTKIVDGLSVSATYVIEIKYQHLNEAAFPVFQYDHYNHFSGLYPSGKEEASAIKKLIEEVIRNKQEGEVLIVTDSALGKIDSYNLRTEPLVDDWYLPVGFHMMYASDSSGGDEFLLNRCIGICDSQAAGALRTAKVQAVDDI